MNILEKIDPRFNPKKDKYQKLEDLPKSKRREFKKSGEGFTTAEATDTPEEAMLQQDYATSLAGLDFSNMVDGKTMREAEKVYLKLKEAKFDFSSIKWEELHLEDLKHIKNPEERKKAAFEKLMNFDDSRLSELIGQVEDMRKSGLIIAGVLLILLMTAGTIAIGQKNLINEEEKRIQYLEKRLSSGDLEKMQAHPAPERKDYRIAIPGGVSGPRNEAVKKSGQSNK